MAYGEALHACETLNRAIVEHVAEGIFLFEATSRRIVQATPAFCRLLGYAEPTLPRLTLYDFIAHDRASIQANIARIAAAGHDAIGDRRYLRRDGTLVTVEVSATALPQRDRTLFGVVVRDVTERRAAEAALAASEARLRVREVQLRAIADNVPVILFTLNPMGVIAFAMGNGIGCTAPHPGEDCWAFDFRYALLSRSVAASSPRNGWWVFHGAHTDRQARL
jgi:PAS domain S-box-containing protein